jgi:hypothetical protein
MMSAQSGGAKVMSKNPFTGVTNVTNEARQARAAANAADLAPIVEELQAAGATSLRGTQT